MNAVSCVSACGTDRGMDTESHDKRIEVLASRLSREFKGPDGSAVDEQHIVEVVQSKARELDDAPIQDFVPLLTEHKAVEDLRAAGLHRELPDQPEAPAHVKHDDTTAGVGVPSAR